MLKTYLFLGNKKLSLNQNIWRDHAIMQQDVFFIFQLDFNVQISPKNATKFSCCLKMKPVENILGYIREQFYRFSRGCKPRENDLKCSKLIHF